MTSDSGNRFEKAEAAAEASKFFIHIFNKIKIFSIIEKKKYL